MGTVHNFSSTSAENKMATVSNFLTHPPFQSGSINTATIECVGHGWAPAILLGPTCHYAPDEKLAVVYFLMDGSHYNGHILTKPP